MPQYKIDRLDFEEASLPELQGGMRADVSLTITNEYPVALTIPPLSFDILTPDCSVEEPKILLANTRTEEIEVVPRENIVVNLRGLIQKFPETVIKTCPNTQKSPLDLLLGDYIRGTETTIYVRGSESPATNTPQWITELLQAVVIPLPFLSHTLDNLIRDFSFTDVHMGLPDPFANPDLPQSHPRLSATVKALVNLPKGINFPISVDKVRANASVYYHHKKIGFFDLERWQTANSTRIEADREKPAVLAIDSIVKDAPLSVTDSTAFAELARALVFGGKDIALGVKAQVDVETETVLGKFVVRDLPAAGKVFVKR